MCRNNLIFHGNKEGKSLEIACACCVHVKWANMLKVENRTYALVANLLLPQPHTIQPQAPQPEAPQPQTPQRGTPQLHTP